MNSFKGIVGKLLLLVVAVGVFGALNMNITRQVMGKLQGVLPPKVSEKLDSLLHLSPATSAAPNRVEVDATPAQAQAAVEAYMHSKAKPDCTLRFLEWTDFTAAGATAAITLRYQVQEPAQNDILATVRFTMQDGTIVKQELIGTGPEAAPSVAMQPVRLRPRAQVIDRFSGPLFAAENDSGMTMQLTDAYSLSQLEQAKQEAQAKRKPLGFIMVWGQFFGHEADPRNKGSDSALVHFYEVFHNGLVLVFVRHESELQMVPEAVRKGFSGPDEGGFAPNMAVTDATATEFITEIPFKGLDGPGRRELFAEGGKKIDLWMATHPDAMGSSGVGAN